MKKSCKRPPRTLSCTCGIDADKRPVSHCRQAMIDEFDLDQDGEINLDVSPSKRDHLSGLLIYVFFHRNSSPS